MKSYCQLKSANVEICGEMNRNAQMPNISQMQANFLFFGVCLFISKEEQRFRVQIFFCFKTSFIANNKPACMYKGILCSFSLYNDLFVFSSVEHYTLSNRQTVSTEAQSIGWSFLVLFISSYLKFQLLNVFCVQTSPFLKVYSIKMDQ